MSAPYFASNFEIARAQREEAERRRQGAAMAAPSADPAPAESALAQVVAELAALLPGLRQAIERQADAKPPVERMALRLDEVADAIGLSRRVIERARSAGRFPKPDLAIGKMPLWRPETVRGWLDGGGAQ